MGRLRIGKVDHRNGDVDWIEVDDNSLLFRMVRGLEDEGMVNSDGIAIALGLSGDVTSSMMAELEEMDRELAERDDPPTAIQRDAMAATMGVHAAINILHEALNALSVANGDVALTHEQWGDSLQVAIQMALAATPLITPLVEELVDYQIPRSFDNSHVSTGRIRNAGA